MNWWELSSKLPDGIELEEFYAADPSFDIVNSCWPKVQQFLRSAHQDKQKVLVNCKAGHNRSACMCVCWLMAEEGMSLLEAVERVQALRGSILSNHAFRYQLVRLASSHGKLDVEKGCG